MKVQASNDSLCRLHLLENKHVLFKVIWEDCVATPHSRECTRPLRVLLAVQCPLQTSPLSRGYATSTSQCHMLLIRYIVLSDPP